MKRLSAKKTVTTSPGQFALLKKRRFGPFFWTQCCGALNDNLFKTALAILMTYQVAGSGFQSHLMVNLAAALFILPFFLFSAVSGQLADKYEKAFLIRRIKAAEVVIMGCAATALLLQQTWLLLVLLFAMGTQSAFFGPVKYSLLPQHLKPSEIVGGNGMVEMGTFGAILLGTMAGGTLIAVPHGGFYVAAAVVLVAIAGWWACRLIPPAPAADPDLRMQWNLISETRRILELARRDKSVLKGMLGISWFWFLGSAYVTQLPNFVLSVLNCRPQAVTLLLAVFSIGVAGGSLLCERLSGRRVELGLVPLAGLSMTLFGWDLAHVSIGWQEPHLRGIGQFIADPGAWRVFMDLGLIGMFGGLYIVPLFAFLQTRTPASRRSRVIAANNVLNALFMVVSALCAALLLVVLEWPLPRFFGLLALLNLVVVLYICRVAPVPLLRIMVWALTRSMYRIRCRGLEGIPDTGPAVLVCNHVSYVDALIIAGSCRRPVHFVMHADYYRIPVLRRLFQLAGVIPITSARANPNLLRKALDRIAETLGAGELVCLFPEGRLTRTGEIDCFRPGIETIVRRNPVPVVPLALRGLWGSMFSHKGGPALRHRPRRVRARIELVAGKLLPAHSVTSSRLRKCVQQLRGSTA